jgi:small subunit ribosomal protein S3
MDMGGEGIRIRVAGRLGGADIARAEQYRQGKVPLQTLRIPIDYGFAEARTVYGIIGVKVWLNRGNAPENTQPRQERRRERRDGDRGGAPRRGERAFNQPAQAAAPVAEEAAAQ